MEPLEIDAGIKEPKVFFDAATGVLEITGRSIPENSFDVYKPLIEWVKGYAANPAEVTKFNFKLNYFNSSSAEYLLDIMRCLEKIYLQGKQVSIFWYFDAEDEDMQQIGEDFKSMLRLPLHMVVNELEED